MPQSKLVLGVSSHGRTLKFANTSNEEEKDFGFEHDGAGEPGPYTQTDGLLAFYEVGELNLFNLSTDTIYIFSCYTLVEGGGEGGGGLNPLN